MNKSNFQEAATEIANLVTEKNKAYGNSFEKSEEIIKVLFPTGIRPDQYKDLLTITRILDKLFRICSGDKYAFEENPWKDVLGYSLLAVCSDKDQLKNRLSELEKLQRKE